MITIIKIMSLVDVDVRVTGFFLYIYTAHFHHLLVAVKTVEGDFKL